ncbi:MAG: T9SS type A sorting domain-containing protein [Bacteroidales bacterium]|nr:T9SS type A sorting domain-containing protein [Bacteroidales bacterium]
MKAGRSLHTTFHFQHLLVSSKKFTHSAPPELQIKVYPNPVGSGEMYIETGQYLYGEPVNVWLFSADGRLIYYKEFLKPGTILIMSLRKLLLFRSGF